MLQWLKENPFGSTMIGVVIVAAIVMVVLTGCQLSDYVKVDVPLKVQQFTGLPSSVPLTHAEEYYEDSATAMLTAMERFRENIDEANWLFTFLTTSIQTGITAAEPAATTLPGGALILTALAGLGGIFIRKPGDTKKINQASIDGYNEALADLQKMGIDEVLKKVGESKV